MQFNRDEIVKIVAGIAHKRDIPLLPEDLDDVVQIVCERLLKTSEQELEQLPKYTGKDEFLPLLCFGELSKFIRKRMRWDLHEKGEQKVWATNDEEDEDKEGYEMSDIPVYELMDYIAELPGEQKDVAELVFIEEYTVREAAEHIGISKSKVGRIAERVRADLRKRYDMDRRAADEEEEVA